MLIFSSVSMWKVNVLEEEEEEEEYIYIYIKRIDHPHNVTSHRDCNELLQILLY